MAAEGQQRAPRVARDRTSMADASASAMQAHRDVALTALGMFSINGVREFDDSAPAFARDCLDGAHAVALVLSNVIDATPDGGGTIRNRHMGAAIGAIEKLIALASFAVEA